MSLAINMAMVASLLAFPSAHGEGRVEGRGVGERFVSVKYGFSMSVPPGWGVSTALDTPVYFFARSSQMFVQDQIPAGGAVIAVEAHDATSGSSHSAKTPREWAVADAQGEASGAPAVGPFEMPVKSEASGAVETSYDEETFTPDERPKHCVAIFWEFRGELFSAHLRFNAGDSIGPRVTNALLGTVRSLRPLAKPSGR